MKALILNSGVGLRMGELTRDSPKCLVQITATDTILSRQLRILMSNGIDNIFMTTGYSQDKIKKYVEDNFSSLNITYIYNPLYNSTNYIYSLYLAQDMGSGDILLIHGDMLFEEKVFKKLLKSEKKDAVLVKKIAELTGKDFKGMIKQGKVTKIGRDLLEDGCYPLFPVYKLSNAFYKSWLLEIDKAVLQGDVNAYAEDALNKILGRVKLEPVYFKDELCMEIDIKYDIEKAQRFLIKEKR